MTYYYHILVTHSLLGKLAIYANNDNIIQITSDSVPSFSYTKLIGNQTILIDQLKSCLLEYFAGNRKIFEIPYAFIYGTDLQKAVWREIAKIPYGNTITYKELAQKAGKPKAIRAVASACGKNPLPILIPCHRVVSSNGKLGGYSLGGIENKKYLLKLEKYI